MSDRISPFAIFDGSPRGYLPTEDDQNVLFQDTPCAQRIHSDIVTARVEMLAVLRRREKGAPFIRPVAVRCQQHGCENITFLHDLDDLRAFERREFFCPPCKEQDWERKPDIYKQAAQKQAVEFFKQAFSQINNQ